MAEFSIQDAALTGFRVVREHPRVLGVLSAVAIVGSLVFAIGGIVLAGPALMQLQAMNGVAISDQTQALALMEKVLPFYLVVIPIFMIFNAFLNAAMMRVVLRPMDRGLAYFAAGTHEVRQFGLQCLWFAVFIGAYMSLGLLALVVGVLVAVVAKAAAALVAVLLVFGVLAALLWLAVRLSLAAPLTFATGRVDLLGSWSLTRGRFWPIFGTYVLAAALTVVVSLLAYVVILLLMAALNGGDPFAGIMRPDMSSLGAYFSGARLIQIVLGALVTALVWPLMLTPPAAIYRSLTDTPGAAFPIGEVFT